MVQCCDWAVLSHQNNRHFETGRCSPLMPTSYFLWLFLCQTPHYVHMMSVNGHPGSTTAHSTDHVSWDYRDLSLQSFAIRALKEATVTYYKWISWRVSWSVGTQPVLDAPSVIPHAASCEYPSFTLSPPLIYTIYVSYFMYFGGKYCKCNQETFEKLGCLRASLRCIVCISLEMFKRNIW